MLFVTVDCSNSSCDNYSSKIFPVAYVLDWKKYRRSPHNFGTTTAFIFKWENSLEIQVWVGQNKNQIWSIPSNYELSLEQYEKLFIIITSGSFSKYNHGMMTVHERFSYLISKNDFGGLISLEDFKAFMRELIDNFGEPCPLHL